jgi:hypothetical protein
MRPKQALVVVALILAGCGGSERPAETTPPVGVSGNGFRFEAPAGWTVERSGRQVTAKDGSELLQVTTFPLVKAYRPELFDAVAGELATRMAQVAQQSGGKIVGTSTSSPAGIKSHVFDVDTGDHVDRYTFVLRGMREYLLLCHREDSDDDGLCDRLSESFALT